MKKNDKEEEACDVSKNVVTKSCQQLEGRPPPLFPQRF